MTVLGILSALAHRSNVLGSTPSSRAASAKVRCSGSSSSGMASPSPACCRRKEAVSEDGVRPHRNSASAAGRNAASFLHLIQGPGAHGGAASWTNRSGLPTRQRTVFGWLPRTSVDTLPWSKRWATSRWLTENSPVATIRFPLQARAPSRCPLPVRRKAAPPAPASCRGLCTSATSPGGQ